MSVDLDTIVTQKFPEHPFEGPSARSNLRVLLSNYLAMSQAFPYLQAGSQKDLIFHYMIEGSDVPVDVELTSVVGNFLAWDETGGFFTMRRLGIEGLPEILNTQRFHANLLKHDLRVLFGEDVAPSYGRATRGYLHKLYRGLADVDAVVRCATMVSFEAHANRMITALWETVSASFGVPKEKLKYFQAHVGGSDPAEQYHVQMTQTLIEKLVAPSEAARFRSLFIDTYALHIGWCAEVCGLSGTVDAEAA